MSSARRAKGEGTISRRSDGTWWARVDLGYIEGKRTRKAFYGPTRAAVAEKMTKALRDVQQGLPIVIGDQSVGAFLADWLENTAKPSIRPTTYRSYSQMVTLHLVPGLGHHRLQKLTPQHLQKWMADRVEAGSSPQLVRYARNVLRIGLSQALAWGLVARNVATLVKPPTKNADGNTVTPREITPLTPEQAQTFLTATAKHRLVTLFAVPLAVGLREGEAIGLKWDCVDLDAGLLHVRRTLQRIGKLWVWGEPKSAKGKRTINLPPVSVTALKAHRTRQLEERLKAGACWHESGLVFSTQVGTPLHPRNVLRDFQRLLKAANLPVIRFHDLRHSCASILLAQGISARVVMEILGHSQISLTLNTYSHVMPTLRQDAADKMNKALGG